MGKVISMILIFLSISSCGKNEEDKKEAEIQYHKCVSNGVEYFKDIGSYPTLKSAPDKGRHALVVARERCEKAPQTAF